MKPYIYVEDADYVQYHGDALETLREMEDGSVDCCVTSPPYYGLRDYGVDGQVGLETSPDEYVRALVSIFAEVRRVLVSTGVLWVNIGDSYAASPGKGGNGPQSKNPNSGYPASAPHRSRVLPGVKPKDLIGVPWTLAFALRADGWWLRSECIWWKPNALPESVRDRPHRDFEHVFQLTPSANYWYDPDSVKVPAAWERWGAQTPRKTADDRARGAQFVKERSRQQVLEIAGERNLRSVWAVNTEPFADAHFAVMPSEVVATCVKASCPSGGTVLDPFGGSGTTALVARRHGRRSILIELNESYCDLAARRLQQLSLLALPAPLLKEGT